jgi:N-acetyl-gamma-glutamylphosphate reductase
LSIFKNYYKECPLISVLDEIPMINDVANKHVVHVGGITVDKTGENLTVCCALDNLLKGAATQTIQNLNSACGLSELTGLNYE